MTHRRSRASAAAFLTVISSLALCAGAWAQSLDDQYGIDGPPVQNPDPGGTAGQEPSTGEEEGADSTGSGEEGADSTGSGEEGADNCDPNYEGACLDPNASDFDCEGGEGDGPRFVQGPIRVVGDDPFDLDRDGNGIACEDDGAGDGGGGSGGGGDIDDEGDPTGGVDSGYGPVAPPREASSPLALVVGAAGFGILVLLGLAGVGLRRAG